MMQKLFFALPLFLSLFTCGKEIIENPVQSGVVEGLRPIYSQVASETVFASEPRPVVSLQSFSVFKEYILVTERNQGIHVLDNSNPEEPVGIHFWNIPGIRNFTVANNNLLVPIGSRLVTIDVADVDNVFLRSIQEDFFENADTNIFPDNYVGSFECVDLSKGVVIGWEETELTEPKCWR